MKLVPAKEPSAFLIQIQDTEGRTISAVEMIVISDIKGGKPAAYIHHVDTDKEFEGKGHATEALQKAEEAARRLGCYKIFLICKKELIPFYERIGMKPEQVGMQKLLL